MTAEIKEITPKGQKLSTPDARVLHDATHQEETDKCFEADNVVKCARTLARADFRKVIRVGLAPTAEERVAHARGES